MQCSILSVVSSCKHLHHRVSNHDGFEYYLVNFVHVSNKGYHESLVNGLMNWIVVLIITKVAMTWNGALLYNKPIRT